MERHTTLSGNDEMFRAVLDRDAGYDGVFIVAVKTTGIFCRPTCPARKPRRENVEFFPTTEDARRAGYRACLRCRPLEPRGQAPEWLQGLLAAVEDDVSLRWRDADLRQRGLDPARVRRWFRREHGMTFHAYLRAGRLGKALGKLRHGEDLTTVALDHGYDSLSGFRDAFRRVFGQAPGQARRSRQIFVSRVLTPLGPMVAGATDDGVCLLEFTEPPRLEAQLRRLSRHLKAGVAPGTHDLLSALEEELAAYFEGSLREFSVPLDLPGTAFQRQVWDGLRRIPYGEMRSYGAQARAIDRPTAVRAVGRANGDNRVAIVIPCHRVVGGDGRLTGYGGGLWRKQTLLEHERRNLSSARRLAVVPRDDAARALRPR